MAVVKETTLCTGLGPFHPTMNPHSPQMRILDLEELGTHVRAVSRGSKGCLSHPKSGAPSWFPQKQAASLHISTVGHSPCICRRYSHLRQQNRCLQAPCHSSWQRGRRSHLAGTPEARAGYLVRRRSLEQSGRWPRCRRNPHQPPPPQTH